MAEDIPERHGIEARSGQPRRSRGPRSAARHPAPGAWPSRPPPARFPPLSAPTRMPWPSPGNSRSRTPHPAAAGGHAASLQRGVAGRADRSRPSKRRPSRAGPPNGSAGPWSRGRPGCPRHPETGARRSGSDAPAVSNRSGRGFSTSPQAGHRRRGPTPSTATCVPAPIDRPVLFISCMRVLPLLENNQVPERPGRVGLAWLMAADQPRDGVGLENALVADALLAQVAVDQEASGRSAASG